MFESRRAPPPAYALLMDSPSRNRIPFVHVGAKLMVSSGYGRAGGSVVFASARVPVAVISLALFLVVPSLGLGTTFGPTALEPEALNRQTVDEVLAAMVGSGASREQALAAAEVAVGKRLEFVGSLIDPTLAPALLLQRDHVQHARHLLAAADAAPVESLARAAAVAKEGVRRQGHTLGTPPEALPIVAASTAPSAAALALLASYGVVPTAAQLADLQAFDALPEPARGALTGFLDAFTVLAKEAHGSRDHRSTAPAPARVLAARIALIDATVALRDALQAQPLTSSPRAVVAPVLSLDLGTSADTYDADFILLLDVGGDDVYLNNAGGNGIRLPASQNPCAAPSSTSTTSFMRAAAALVDLAGNDQYASGRSCGVNGGAMRGMGFLLDASGDDLYLAGEQGTNGGALLSGSGFLLDATGDDRYQATEQGTNGGADNGAGFLLDGAGDDAYVGTRIAVNGGVYMHTDMHIASGVLVDLNGNDLYQATEKGVNAGVIAPSDHLTERGSGFLLDVAGDDRYVSERGGANAGVFAQRLTAISTWGSTGGAGFLFDVAGSDVYAARGRGANGGAIGTGVGLLLDATGNDRYTTPAEAAALLPMAGGGAGAGFLKVGLLPDLTGTASFVVGVHELPEGLGLGAPFLGGTVARVDPVLRFLEVGTAAPLAFVTAAAVDARVRYVEAVGTGSGTGFTPDDPLFAEQGYLHQLRVPDAWDVQRGDAAVKVCVLDSGVRYTHEDLAGARYLGGYDFINNDDDPWDDHGHGTHVTSLAVSNLGNGAGIAGVAQVGYYHAKVLNHMNFFSTSGLAAGIRWCADSDAVLLSMSLGSENEYQVVREAIQYAASKGKLLIGASGNNPTIRCIDCILFPARYEEVLSVTCVSPSDGQCGITRMGPENDIAAPGVSILGADYGADDAYRLATGTSMSAPLVAGIAALMWSAAPDLTACNVRALLTGSARDRGAAGWDDAFGHGVADASAALSLALGGARPTTCVRTVQSEGWYAYNGGGLWGGVGILLDVEGGDRYEANGWRGVNGGGWANGAGLLVDGSGDDLYRAGQIGVNGGADGGCDPTRSGACNPETPKALGALADGAGVDSYQEGLDPPALDVTRLAKGSGVGLQLDVAG